MRVRFVLGPAGSGKTFRVLSEIRQSLASGSEGPALILLAPKQTTYQLERQLLADPAIPGYTRLQILSFERLSHFVFDEFRTPAPEMLNEEGRVMVLRGLLARKRDKLKLFRASSRLTGFAQELSAVLSELQRNEQSPENLASLAQQLEPTAGLAGKLRDFGMLLRDYLDWLESHQLQDADSLIPFASGVLKQAARAGQKAGPGGRRFGSLWVDGFGEWTAREVDLLAALVPHCDNATFTFCLDAVPSEKVSWLSVWSVVRRSYEELRKRLDQSADIKVEVELLPRDPARTRFDSPILQRLERAWPQSGVLPAPVQSPAPISPAGKKSNVQLEWLWPGEPETASRQAAGKKSGVVERVAAGVVSSRTAQLSQPGAAEAQPDSREISKALRVASCADPDAEAILAAREILRHAQSGGRYREVAVLVRDLPRYNRHLERAFAQYEIPYFMDRRESMGHHPLAELTRSALRTVVSRWRHEEWFAVLKTGLVRVEDEEIDLLENEALARGWNGRTWQEPIRLQDEEGTDAEREETRRLEQRLEGLRSKIMAPFAELAAALEKTQNHPNGQQLATALRKLWEDLQIEKTLEEWSAVPDPAMPEADSVHGTLWEQMQLWLKNIELAFPAEPTSLRDWLPIVDAGLSTLTVGIIPPALDQVLVGAIDRSRSPDVRLALLLGMNENVFPSPAQASPLLTETEREALEKEGVSLSSSARRRLGRERYLAYIACTRARERVVFTSALHDADGAPMHASPFLSRLKELFPALTFETVARTGDWREAVHATELVEPLLRNAAVEAPAPDSIWSKLANVPSLANMLKRLGDFRLPGRESLDPELAGRLYGPVLHTSVSRMERFGSCPFQFFVHSGLRAEERTLFEFDSKEQGSFQHDVLARFHQQLRGENKRWRDIKPEEAREMIAQIAQTVGAGYRGGLMQATEQNRFTSRALTESLQDFVETLVGWMQEQYQFDPVEVELPFGDDDESPAWRLKLNNGRELALYGRIDRVDLLRRAGQDDGLCVVVDYKSSRKQLDPVLMAHGIQLQLMAYLNVLRHWPDPRAMFGAGRLVPAGVFYVNLKGKYEPAHHRTEALADLEQARKIAYRHNGRFDMTLLPHLDARPNAGKGDQFNYRLTDAGEIHRNCKDPVPAAEFKSMLDSAEASLKKMGAKIFSGIIEVSPYRKQNIKACAQCNFSAICRIDPWTHRYRLLNSTDEPEPEEESAS